MRRIISSLALVSLVFVVPVGAEAAPAKPTSVTVNTVAGPLKITSSDGKFTRASLIAAPAGAPGGLVYPIGFTGISVGSLKKGAKVTLRYDVPAGVNANTWVRCAPSCTQAALTGGTISYSVTDGGAGDGDGARNGAVADRAAAARPDCELKPGTNIFDGWTGTIQPEAAGIVADPGHESAFELPGGCAIVSATVRIEWDVTGQDIDLAVTDPAGNARVAETGNTFALSTFEELVYDEPSAGTYRTRAYGFLNGPTDYRGTVTVEMPPAPSTDTDLDGVSDATDNCRTIHNPTQANRDSDSAGDACDDAVPSIPLDQRTQIFSANGTSGTTVQGPELVGIVDAQGTGHTEGGQFKRDYVVTLSNQYSDYSELEVRLDWEQAGKDYLTLEVREPGGAISTCYFVNTNYQEIFIADPAPGEYLVSVYESRTTTGMFTASAFATRSEETPLPPLPPIASDPSKPRVVVADLDSAINPYHSFYYGGSEIYPNTHPSSVTQEVLDVFGVKPENVVTLTRTGNFAADIAADEAFWAGVQHGELYHFRGTNIIASSFAPTADGPPLKPLVAKSAHGVGTSSAVLRANPDAIMLFGEAGTNLGSDASHRFAFLNLNVDIVTTSYGASVPAPVIGSTGFPMPEYRTFEHTHEAVVGMGKLHFSSGGNGPGVTPARAGAGPWWSIGVSGIEEGSSEGDTLLSGNLPDFVSDYTQDLPYCNDCEAGYQPSPGTSFSTPRAAGVASKVLLDARRSLGHTGGIATIDGKPTMAAGNGKAVTNWQLRRALEQAAWTPDSLAYDPAEAPFDLVGLPIAPVVPFVQTGWGDLTADPARGVVPAALAELGFGGTAREKGSGTCEFQTAVIEERKLYWNEVAPAIPVDVLGGEVPPGAGPSDPFVYC